MADLYDPLPDLADLVAASVHENAIPSAVRLASKLRVMPESGAKVIEARLREAIPVPRTPADADAFPLTCEWCNAAPATHLLIVDVKAQGSRAAKRSEHRICAANAHSCSVLPPSFVGYWLYELVPDHCEGV
jgi:hypothetical protein